jgi:hypothetical protein
VSKVATRCGPGARRRALSLSAAGGATASTRIRRASTAAATARGEYRKAEDAAEHPAQRLHDMFSISVADIVSANNACQSMVTG